MIKHHELKNPLSCLNRANDGEMIFVLLARDVAAPLAIRAWAQARVSMGKNVWEDKQIIEAIECANEMDQVHLRKRNAKDVHYDRINSAIKMLETNRVCHSMSCESSVKSGFTQGCSCGACAANKQIDFVISELIKTKTEI